MSEWKSIKSARKTVFSSLILTDGKHVGTGFWSNLTKSWDWCDDWGMGDEPTHWMDFPKPPKTGKLRSKKDE